MKFRCYFMNPSAFSNVWKMNVAETIKLYLRFLFNHVEHMFHLGNMWRVINIAMF